jgi:hypothetical protein
MLVDEVDTTEEWSHKLNLLAVNRRSKIVMETIVPDEGNVFISTDLISAEPMVLLNYSEDKVLYDILYTYKKKPAEWVNGVFMSKNIYLTCCSRIPFVQDKLQEIEAKYQEDIASIFNRDPDLVKDELGKVYDTLKALVLALLYGLSVNGVQRQLTERGYKADKKFSADFYHSFWSVLTDVQKLRDCQIDLFEKAFRKKMPVCNPFFTPLPSGRSKDALNRIVQSSVSSFIRMVCCEVFTKRSSEVSARLVAIIHDELITEVSKNDVAKFKEVLDKSVAYVNDTVGLQYPLGLGLKEVTNFYAK